MLLLPDAIDRDREKKPDISSTYSNVEIFNKGPTYKKAEPQTPLYSNLSDNSTYSNLPSYANLGIFPIFYMIQLMIWCPINRV